MRRTPCIGICSTTYGDLVCRGCKRFAHEVAGWNGFGEPQQALVWGRLADLLRQSVRACVTIEDEARLRAAAVEARLPAGEDASAELVAFELLRRQARGPGAGLTDFGLRAVGSPDGAGEAPAGTVARIDREFYQRSVAHYERSFRVLAR